MKITSTTAGNTAIIALSGQFDFNDLRTFKAAYEVALTQAGIDTLEIELSNLNYIDSTALGMLMLLRQRARAADKIVVLKHPNQVVREVLEIANLGNLFTII
jgi:anti-anti-sigma factor